MYLMFCGLVLDTRTGVVIVYVPDVLWVVLDTRTEVVIVYVPDVLWVGVRYQD